MTQELATVAASPAMGEGTTEATRLLAAFLGTRSPHTLEAYRRDLADFAAHLGLQAPQDALTALLSNGQGHANLLAHNYKGAMLEAGLASATINRHLAALRSVVKLARTLGLVPFSLDVESMRSEPYRDTAGPGREGYRAMLGKAEEREDAKGARDRAIVRLLHDLALRRGEVVSLDLGDFEREHGKLFVLGKGKRERVALTLPAATQAALQEWLSFRGEEPGPLFLNFDRAGKGHRLTGRSVARIIGKLGAEVGLRVRPHGLRHTAITEALDLTGGNVRAVQRFSRHKDLRVLTLYDDNRADMGGEIARLLACEA